MLAHAASVRPTRPVRGPHDALVGGDSAAYDWPTVRYRNALPQLDGEVLLTDGGMETTLVFVYGIELPCFASFPLLETEDGRTAMTSYFEPYLAAARRLGTGFVVEANTWRANPSWGSQLGYSLDDLAEANRRCVAFVAEHSRPGGATGPTLRDQRPRRPRRRRL